MDNIQDYIDTVSGMLNMIFKWTETTLNECRQILTEADENNKHISIEIKQKLYLFQSTLSDLNSIIQFGDIIEQSFESFHAIFDEFSRIKIPDHEIGYEQAEKFSKLVGGVSTNTFCLIGNTMAQLKDRLELTGNVLRSIASNYEKLCPQRNNDFKFISFITLLKKCDELVKQNIDGIDKSIKHAVFSTEGIGLFCIHKIISIGNNNDSFLEERLYKKFRVREHIEILSSLFPTTRSFSKTGSLEIF